MNEKKMNIPFCSPDIREEDIAEVVDTLRSGWITTGPKTKKLGDMVAKYCKTERAVCLNSATDCMESILRLFEIGAGDEVITTAYTYTASASVIHHVGAKIILVDTAKDSFFMDYDQLEKAITPKTKAIITVDLGGVLCDYDRIFDIVESKKALFSATGLHQEALGRVLVLADAAHSLGATYKGKISGEIADFTSFSFHAVKNLTTAEGGAITWNPLKGINDNTIYEEFMLSSLHGQSKDAFSKNQLGAWEYDVLSPAYKCNMTDMQASLGLGQLKRYPELLKRRKEIIGRYNQVFENLDIQTLQHEGEDSSSSGHLYLVRLMGKNSIQRNEVIMKMAKHGIVTNVHYKPLPLHTAYKNLGFKMEDYPNAYAMYKNEITLPLHTCLTDEEVAYVAENMKNIVKGRPKCYTKNLEKDVAMFY